MRADLIKRLRKHAEFETPVIADDRYPPEITWKELGQLAALLSEAADALAAPVSRSEARLVERIVMEMRRHSDDIAAMSGSDNVNAQIAAKSIARWADELAGVLVRPVEP